MKQLKSKKYTDFQNGQKIKKFSQILSEIGGHFYFTIDSDKNIKFKT